MRKTGAPQGSGCEQSGLCSDVAPQVGLEPTTTRLTAGCSAIELLRNTGIAERLYFLQSVWNPATTYSPGPLPAKYHRR